MLVFSLCARSCECSFLVALQRLEIWTTDKTSYHIEKLKNSIKNLESVGFSGLYFFRKNVEKWTVLTLPNISLWLWMRSFTSFISKKKYNFYCPDLFFLNMYFLCSHDEWKPQIEMGVTDLVSSQNDNKGSISASNDRFARGDWGKFQDKLRIIKIAIKSIWTANAALVTSFLATSENHRHLEVAMLCALSDAQGKIRELP